MNKEIYNNNSTNNTQQKPDNSKTVCQHSWGSIYNNFHPVRRLPSVTICLVLATFLFFTGYVNTKNSGEINRHTQSPALGNQSNKIADPLTTELSSDKQDNNNVHQRTFMQMTILSDN